MTALISDDLLISVANVIGGEEAARVVVALQDLGEATDDQILAKTGIGLNDIRKALFKLYDYSIVQCSRERNQDTGWFIFHWKLQPEQVEGFIQNQKARILKILVTRMDYEKEHDFYYCFTTNCDRVSFEDAMELVFRCPVCGKPLQHFDNRKTIKALEERVKKLRKEIG